MSVLYGKEICVPQHAQRMMRPVLILSAVALVRRSSSLSQPSSPYPCTSISTVWPALNAARRAATAASEVLLNGAVKVTGYLVVGIDGIDPLSKSNGIETARTSTPASDACDSSLTTSTINDRLNRGKMASSEEGQRTLPIHSRWFSRLWRGHDLRVRRSSVPSIPESNPARWRRLRDLDEPCLDSEGEGSCQRSPCWVH